MWLNTVVATDWPYKIRVSTLQDDLEHESHCLLILHQLALETDQGSKPLHSQTQLMAGRIGVGENAFVSGQQNLSNENSLLQTTLRELWPSDLGKGLRILGSDI